MAVRSLLKEVTQNHHEDKTKGAYEDRVVRYPLGLGTILHAEYVRETLESAAKLPAPGK